jgi:hypothetical protein
VKRSLDTRIFIEIDEGGWKVAFTASLMKYELTLVLYGTAGNKGRKQIS